MKLITFLIFSIFVSFSCTNALELELMRRFVAEFATELQKELRDMPSLISFPDEEGSGQLNEVALNFDNNEIADTSGLEALISSTEGLPTTTTSTTTSTTTTTTPTTSLITTTLSTTISATTRKLVPACIADRECTDDKECGFLYRRKNRCMGSALGRCNCNACVGDKPCDSDADCGGLRTACREGSCHCSQALTEHGFFFMIDAILNFCNQKRCRAEGDDCHGLPCNVGRCKCN